ncbi:MAG TPA: thioredoxin domain-containing protein [Rhizomicrobium sp.]|nr:thioredoxin domain-containing protein [Rhizomicrobium sp.]
MSRKTLLIVLGVILLIAAAGIGYYVTSGSNKATAGSGQGYEILPTDKTLGNRNSKVVLIEYAAPSCPVCAAFNVQNFPKLKAQYIDTGKIFYVFRVFPLRADDGSAEKIARCLPEDKYFAFIDLLFKNQPKWDVEFGVQSPEGVHQGLVLLGRIAGMSAQQVDQCMANKAEDDRINKVASDGESRYGINATPTFILNGTKIGSGNIPFDSMSKLLDTELAKQH